MKCHHCCAKIYWSTEFFCHFNDFVINGFRCGILLPYKTKSIINTLILKTTAFFNIQHFSLTFINELFKHTNELECFVHFPNNIDKTYDNKKRQKNWISGYNVFIWIVGVHQKYTIRNKNQAMYEEADQEPCIECNFSNRLGCIDTIESHMLLGQLKDFHFFCWPKQTLTN